MIGGRCHDVNQQRFRCATQTKTCWRRCLLSFVGALSTYASLLQDFSLRLLLDDVKDECYVYIIAYEFNLQSDVWSARCSLIAFYRPLLLRAFIGSYTIVAPGQQCFANLHFSQ